MKLEAWPTEGMATKAVEAAAQQLHARIQEIRAKAFPNGVAMESWADASPVDKNNRRQDVLPLVWAALEALPDPRHGAWNEGHYSGYAEAVSDEGGDTPPGVSFENPYPEPEIAS